MKKLIFFFFLFSSVSVFGQSRVVPIVETRVNGLLGGVENGRYLNAKQTAAKLVGEGRFNLFDLSGAAGNFSFMVEKPDVPCEDFYPLKSATEPKPGIAIGNEAKWKPMPRNISQMDVNNASYKKIVADVLRTKGIVTKNAVITQALRVDLDGDGTEEVLIAATSYQGMISPSAKKNDYSFVMLRKIIGGKAQNIVITGDFIRKNIQFGAPAKFEVSSVADLNGDGKMEVIVYGAYYEGNWVDVYELKGNIMREVKALNAGCGV